jgi:hypothetical protein
VAGHAHVYADVERIFACGNLGAGCRSSLHPVRSQYVTWQMIEIDACFLYIIRFVIVKRIRFESR